MIRTAAMAILFATSLIAHASEEAKIKADPAKGKVIAETVCVACHGADGNSPAATGSSSMMTVGDPCRGHVPGNI